MNWRAERDYAVPVLLVCLVIGVLFVWLMPGCASRQPPDPCIPTLPAAIVAECRAQYRQAGCATDPERLCPELVRACDARIDALTDAEVCGR